MSEHLLPGENLILRRHRHWMVAAKAMVVPVLVVVAAVLAAFQRVLLSYGVFSRTSKVIPIDRVQDVSTQQSLLGRALGYGRVEIDAAGSAGAEGLDHMPDPNGFRDEVFVQSGRP